MAGSQYAIIKMGRTGSPVKVPLAGRQWRDLLGPDCARLIDVGYYWLLDAYDRPLNLDSPIPSPDELGDDPIELTISRRSIAMSWVDEYPELDGLAVFVLVPDEPDHEHDATFAEAVVHKLEGEGIAAALFRDPKAIREACDDPLLQEFRVLHLAAVPVGRTLDDVQSLVGKEQDGAAAGPRIVPGYAFCPGARHTGVSVEVLSSVQPCVLRLPQRYDAAAIEWAAKRLVASPLYDVQLSDELSHGDCLDYRDAVRSTWQRWLEGVRRARLNIDDLERGLNEFLWKLQEYRGAGILDRTVFAKEVASIPALADAMAAIHESVDVEVNAHVFKKNLELIEAATP